MGFLAILKRELLLRSRTAATYRIRLLSGGLGLGIVLWLIYGDFIQSSHNSGGTLLHTLMYATYGLITASAVVLCGDAISSERREDTLNLLRMTQLTPVEIFAGKWLSGFINQAQLILCALPLIVVSSILGGVQGSEIARAALVLIFYAAATCGLALLASAICVSAQAAQALASLLVVVYGTVGLWPLLGSAPFWLEASPLSVVHYSFSENYRSAGPIWWGGFGSLIIFWLITILIGGICLNSGPLFGWRNEEPSHRKGSNEKVEALKQRQPFVWLAFRRSPSQLPIWAILVFILGWCFLHIETSPSDALLALLVPPLALKLWGLVQSSLSLAEDREGGGLELLLTTPIALSDVTEGQRGAYRKRMMLPLTAILLSGAAVAAFITFSLSPEWGWAYLAIEAALLIDLFTICWVGVWSALTAKRAWHSTFLVCWRVLLRPSLIFAALIAMTGLRAQSTTELILIWLVIGVVNNLFAWAAAYNGLKDVHEFSGVLGRRPAEQLRR